MAGRSALETQSDFFRAILLEWLDDPETTISLEARFLTTRAGGAPTDRWSVSLMHSQPYDRQGLRPAALNCFFAAPMCLSLLEQSLKLREASLVIYRDRTLVEFKTDRLDAVHRYEERGHISWQIGVSDDHHCHLSLAAVESVLFSAEPVPCQGGGLNYTIWFLASGSAGNPWRRDGDSRSR